MRFNYLYVIGYENKGEYIWYCNEHPDKDGFWTFFDPSFKEEVKVFPKAKDAKRLLPGAKAALKKEKSLYYEQDELNELINKVRVYEIRFEYIVAGAVV